MLRRTTTLAAAAAATVLAVCTAANAEDGSKVTWKKIPLTDKFYSEGANAGDFNKDGKMDVVYGPFWWEGPDFTKRHQIFKPTGKEVEGSWKPDNDYSRDAFFAFTHDFDNDGYVDYLVYGFPGEAAKLYINPKGKDEPWKMYKVFDVVDNESPMFGDFDGDGKPEGVFHTNSPKVVPPEQPGADGKRKVYGVLGIVKPDWSDPTKPWTFEVRSPKREYFQRFTHGFGYGDINGDGKNDMMEARSWWENTGSAGELKEHPYPFANGGAQMYVYDVDGDGLNDVITSHQAHGVGLAWHKQGPKNDKGEITFKRNFILPDKYEPNKQGIKFSQLHAVDLVDINGDGLKDIVTGKRHFAHGSKGDVDPTAPAVVYWFELKRNPDKSVEWIGHQADQDAGVGVQVVATDVSGDGKPDILIGNKKGAAVLIQQ